MAATVLATRQVPASSGSANVAQATLDFGSPRSYDASTVVTGQAWVTATSKIVAQVFGVTADHPDPVEPIIEQIAVSVGVMVVGVGFTIFGHAPNTTYGQYLVNITGA